MFLLYEVFFHYVNEVPSLLNDLYFLWRIVYVRDISRVTGRKRWGGGSTFLVGNFDAIMVSFLRKSIPYIHKVLRKPRKTPSG